MAENRKRLTGRSQKQTPDWRRRLRFEPLESRSLLSVATVAAPGPRQLAACRMAAAAARGGLFGGRP